MSNVLERTVDGNDASIISSGETGRVHYVKADKGYGFIRPDNKSYDDIFFHFSDIEPWRNGFKEVRGYCREPYFAGEKVKFNIVIKDKIVKDKSGNEKQAYSAKSIEILEV